MNEERVVTLPSDNYDVHVENERDALSLLWIVNSIGERKLRNSTAKRNKCYPDAKLFVSKIAKRFRLSIPRSVYAPRSVPVYWVYVLALKDRSEVKVGMTGRWPSRAVDYVKTANYTLDFSDLVLELFDGERSIAYLVCSEDAARRLEADIKERFADSRIDKPPLFGGYTEWFRYDVCDRITAHIAANALDSAMSLREGLKWQADIDETGTKQPSN